MLVWEGKEEAEVEEILQHLASLHAAAAYRTVNNSALVKQVRTYSDVNAFNPLNASGANFRISLLLRSLKKKIFAINILIPI